MLGSSISIQDVDENERVKIGIGMCKDQSIVPMLDHVVWKIA